jgi:hypothetical protein
MVPDIGDFDEVEVIEVLVNAGDELSAEDCDYFFTASSAFNIKN